MWDLVTTYYGVEVFSTLDLYNLAWQAGFICTLVGLTRTNVKSFDREEAIASLKNLFNVSNEQFATAA